MDKFLETLKEGGVYSLTRILSVIGYAAFLIGSAYLIYTGKTWGNYDSFAVVAGAGGAGLQIGNKFINSKYNSPIGRAGKQVGCDFEEE